ncbi:hypothetical protein Q8W71_24345 [Methylobacterium sp. NEAU 140]|uniref:hypothetical protein n=1 Tax=Methylobacterium sp. NEAU 140 TaxID=3064945 RepID=UPI002732DA67|nr:hypothetical protein [Methylobacterium sp. NEAU 140]MDP4025766.1 hypothetical protein [Methylobacterium sp. NEAU 140]
MSTLFRKPVQATDAGKIVAAAVLAFATLAVLGLFWWSLSPILGRVYAGIRLAETATLWRFTGWGRYFTGMPAGQPFAFVSIYKSSVGFGLAATLITALLGFLAWRKRSREHIEVLITAPAAGFAQEGILCAFDSADRRVRTPVTDAGAPAPAANPFKALRDLRDIRAVETVEESVLWHLAAALFLTADATAPLADRKARDAVLKAARTAADRLAADPVAELPTELLSTLRGYMLVAITEQAGRDIDALNQIHAVLGRGDGLRDVLAELAALAVSRRVLFFPDYAWLRHVDPNLQSRITSYGGS